MCSDLAALLPRDKFDTERAEAIVALGFPAVEPIVPALLEWMQDMNWPVARVLQPFLAGIGTPLYPHLRRILQTDDDVWKNWTLRFIVAQSAELQAKLRTDLERLATSPTAGEQAEELDIVAKDLLS
ncbi:hypothetical protein ACVIHI_001841 [Bradyrhizobium sp. USDA 4524]|uniref:DUF5071 domain-containing protein n=1 Tax=unclassified Bradyrhizobium TaxID=2631580 RepID=UPI0020A11BBA|nr:MULTISPECIES: DUF5071 domain-containing protein [unclassified Bradyrhizobium]MCP1845238.1 hypothetical protein [Bradyrhizobium sp. USDA 4538]MCP1905802.1 hypothetical protein [Bradyrhizobium sp. USDA 4537]MCP1988542.1 hypothetical protein [Bradyrhizobium sp. USDA 4539]